MSACIDYLVFEDPDSQGTLVQLIAAEVATPESPNPNIDILPYPCIHSPIFYAPQDTEPQVVGQSGTACVRFSCDGYWMDLVGREIDFDSECDAQCQVPCMFDAGYNLFLGPYIDALLTSHGISDRLAPFDCSPTELLEHLLEGAEIRFNLCCRENHDVPYFECSEIIRRWVDGEVNDWIDFNCRCRSRSAFQEIIANSINIPNTLQSIAEWAYAKAGCVYPELTGLIPNILDEHFAQYRHCCESSSSEVNCFLDAADNALSDITGTTITFCDSGEQVPTRIEETIA